MKKPRGKTEKGRRLTKRILDEQKAKAHNNYERGEVRVVGADKMSSGGYVMISIYITKKQSLTASTKLVWGDICRHAWQDNDSCFPGQKKLAEDLGMSERTVRNCLKQLEGDNLDNETFLNVIQRGKRTTNVYELWFKMPDDKRKKRELMIGKNFRSSQGGDGKNLPITRGKNFRSYG